MATKKLKMSELKKIIKEELQGVMEAEPAAIDFGDQPAAAQPAALKEGDYIIFALKVENPKFVAKVQKINNDGTISIGPSMLSPGLGAVEAKDKGVRKATAEEIKGAI